VATTPSATSSPASPLKERASEMGKFVLGLAEEGERSAVVLGASRADALLEELLRTALKRHPGGSDNLFDPDRPLGTFSARIALAFRMGVIDDSCGHALQMLRKIRNDFAHSSSRATLSESRHRSRVVELVREAKKVGKHYDKMDLWFDKCDPTLRSFCAAVSVVLSRLDFAAIDAKQVEPPFTASLRDFEKES
jgi:hypothetical protein